MSQIESTNWRLVELGRVVLINKGPDAGKLAAVVEIIDHKRVLISGQPWKVARQGIALNNVTLTNIVVPKIPRSAGDAVVAKKWAAADICSQWKATAWAKKIAQRERRRQLTDFERFQVLVLKKQRRDAVRKAVAKAN